MRSVLREQIEMESDNREISIVEEHYKYAESIAHSVVKSFDIPASYMEDMFQEAYIGLIEASEKYDPKSKVPFKSFAYLRIRGAIIDHLRGRSDLGRSGYKAAKMFKAVQDFGEEVVQESKDTDAEELTKVLEYMAKGALVFKLSTEDVADEVESIQDKENSPELKLQAIEKRKSLKKIVETVLDEREKEVINSYYFEDKSFKEILEKMDISKSWISRIHKDAINKIKNFYFESDDFEELVSHA